MSVLRTLLPSGRALWLLDAVVLAWTIIWIALGLAIAGEVRGLHQLSGTVVKVGVATQQTGQALDALGGVPLVGDQVGKTAASIQEAGRSTIASGRQSRASIHNLSWMLGLFMAVIPTLPLLGLYLPVRIGFERERRALQAVVARHAGDDALLRRVLAQRALLSMPYHQLVRLRPDLVDDAGAERTDELADAELVRMGVRRPERSHRRSAGAAR
ncbi:MAG TPA: hypothetical protein VFT50_07075 [Baekduia sp.]|nr:hypothetical protein [Baekduia sp.]